MKKLLLVFVLVVLVSLVGCFEKKTVEVVEESGDFEVSYTFTEFLGNDKNGTAVKEMLSKLIKDNEGLNDDNKINVELRALKGKVSATNDKEKILKIYSYIGGKSSLYNTYMPDKNDSGEEINNLLVINQIEGSSEDPDIPIEPYEDEMFSEEFSNYIEVENQ